MTIAELLALLGRAWLRLALFPGGLAALAVIWIAGWALTWERARRPAERQAGAAGGATHHRLARGQGISAAAFPLLAVALLPLPYTRPLERPLDAVVLLTLLEWPRLLAVTSDLRGSAADTSRAVRRLAGALNGYPPAILALLLVGQGVGSLELGLLAAGPLDGRPPFVWALFLGGALGLVLALPPLVEAGPFAAGDGARYEQLLVLGLRLRVLGYVLLAALPWFALLPPAREDGAPALWLAPLPPLLLALLLWGFDRAFAGRRALPWAHGYLWLSLALLLGHAAGAALALRERMA